MSKGPGWVERRLAELFAGEAAKARTFTPEELAQFVYGVEWPEKKHRVAVLRAVRNILPADWQETKWWCGMDKLMFHHQSITPTRR